MGKTLSSSPAWVKASWISWKNSGSRDGATVATAWRRAGSDRAGMGINGSSPAGTQQSSQPAASHVHPPRVPACRLTCTDEIFGKTGSSDSYVGHLLSCADCPECAGYSPLLPRAEFVLGDGLVDEPATSWVHRYGALGLARSPSLNRETPIA